MDLLFEEYLPEKKNICLLYTLKLWGERHQNLEEGLEGGKLGKNLEIF